MDWLSIPHMDVYAVIGILTFFALLETIHGHYHETHREKDDWILEGFGFFIVAGTKTFQVLLVVWLGDMLLPQFSNSLSGWSIWLAFPFYILIDDVMQYAYHRLAHENAWLWKHHVAHHAAEDMGILVSYRNSWVYYVLMPNLWWGAICTYLGLAPAVILGLIVKQIVVTSSHSTWKWDQFLYKRKWLNPLSFLLQRIFITPAFHHAHHGKSQADGVSEPNGNYGNTFSFWDQLFGTAVFSKQYPKRYGLITDPQDPWYALLFYPFVKSPKKNSEMAPGFEKTSQKGTEPFRTKLEAGDYLFCQCGFSTNQPFCNGYHHGTQHRPLKFTIEKERNVSLCTCKLTKKPPYCDGSHKQLNTSTS